MTARTRLRPALALLAAGALVAACGSDDDAGPAAGDSAPRTVRLLAHDSFAVSDQVLDAFTDETGIEVEIILGGDAGTVVNQALLAKGNPQADVLFGIDSTFLGRALAEDLFIPYEAEGLDEVDPALHLDDEHRVTPVDYGDVCINYDREWFAEEGLPVPESLEDLVDPAYEGLLVVENPATSSPGLTFLLGTIEALGDGWEDWWTALRANGLTVVNDWESAYYSEFSGGLASEGTKPLVVSYASSPPVEVLYAEEPLDEAPTGVVTAGCTRQIEGAGILAGTDRLEEAQALIDFLLSEELQADVPLQMFVHPVRSGVELPEEFAAHAVTPDEVVLLDAEAVDASRDAWIDRWTELVLG